MRPATLPEISVVVATYNRWPLLERLLRQLLNQSLSRGRYEVIVVDDGSREPVAPRVESLGGGFPITVVTQANAGAGAARNRGISRARGNVVLLVDDDMQVASDFVETHLCAHKGEGVRRRVVLGRVTPDPGQRLPLYERYHAAMLERFMAEALLGRRIEGTHLYTGNVSFPRPDFLAVGGFDTSFRHAEDAELGVRLQKAGLEFAVSERAESLHASPHGSLEWWMRRSFVYGTCDVRIARKHAEMVEASPWRYLFLVSPVSRPLLLVAALAPPVGALVAWLAIGAAHVAGSLGFERLAIAGATLVFGLQYFRGVRQETGGLGDTVGDLRAYVAARNPNPNPQTDRHRRS